MVEILPLEIAKVNVSLKLRADSASIRPNVSIDQSEYVPVNIIEYIRCTLQF